MRTTKQLFFRFSFYPLQSCSLSSSPVLRSIKTPQKKTFPPFYVSETSTSINCSSLNLFLVYKDFFLVRAELIRDARKMLWKWLHRDEVERKFVLQVTWAGAEKGEKLFTCIISMNLWALRYGKVLSRRFALEDFSIIHEAEKELRVWVHRVREFGSFFFGVSERWWMSFFSLCFHPFVPNLWLASENRFPIPQCNYGATTSREKV